jgi:hypothetical protein
VVGKSRRVWVWVIAAVVIVLLAFVAILVVPILTHQSQGGSEQVDSEEEWPLLASAVGDDGRTRTIDVQTPGGALDTSALREGDRIVVSGTGFDASRGIYVAICKVPDAGERPGPCLGGVPETSGEEQVEGSVQYAPSNWINNDWAWKLFGARSYDDPKAGTFTAYLQVADPVGEGVDCRVDECAIFTRNDHTALNDRVQDVRIPVAFAN